MGIRSLLRNAFGRSKAARDESRTARKNADKPESATIPEAREESTPAPAAAPEAEVPAARTAPADPTPASTPAAASLPAQSSPVDRAPEPAAKTASATADEAPVGAEPPTEAAVTTDAPDQQPIAAEVPKPTADTSAPKNADTDDNADAPKDTDQGADHGTETVKGAATHERAPEEAALSKDLDEPAAAEASGPQPGAETEAPAPAVSDSAADLVSQAFDNPAPAAAAPAEDDSEPKPAAQPQKEAATAEAAATAAAVTPEQTEKTEEPKKAEEAAPAATPEAADKAADATSPDKATDASAPEAAPTAPAAEPVAQKPVAQEAAEQEQEPVEQAPAPASAHPVAAAAPALLPLYEAARTTLEKHQLTTQRATVYLVLDRSGSMRNYYKDGTVQHLAEQALGLSAHLDEKATVPVMFFSTDVDGTADLDLTTYEGRIEELHAGLGHMGRTNYHWAIEAVVEHYKKSGSTAPAFVIFQTDGAPTSKPAAERALCEAAKLPIFWQFIGFGDPEAKGFDFLRKLDDLTIPEKRVVDNAGFFHAGRAPRDLSHEELYQQLMVEFPEWLAEARAAKVLKDS
ncbi:VWA domain-containing protein [Streptomyces sp. NPDC093097]|uniref:VWA domain-containing protein n=1 Tax=Streptomyces sp. NPDC093097 TaxID=3366027 RepID=UPI00380C571C